MKNIIGILKGFFLSIKNILRNLRDYKYSRFYPNNPRHDDVYIVEFPKSGITWLSTLIANVNLLESNKKTEATFFNLHQYIADIHSSKDINHEPIWSFPKYRFIKSHDVYNKNYHFVIYLIRDPFKVMNSYYIFLKQLGVFKGNIEDFVKHPKYGIDAWLSHVNSWLDRGMSSQRVHLVKYEDLIKRPFEEIKKIYGNLGLPISEENIKAAIESSSISNMKISEALHNKNNPNYHEFEFVGKGEESYNKIMSNEAKNYISKRVELNSTYKSLCQSN